MKKRAEGAECEVWMNGRRKKGEGGKKEGMECGDLGTAGRATGRQGEGGAEGVTGGGVQGYRGKSQVMEGV